MTIASNLERIIAAKADIKAAIGEKGVEVPDAALISDYHTYIDQINSAPAIDPDNPTLAALKLALATNDPSSYYPIGTEIPDTWDGNDNPLIVAQYTSIRLSDGSQKPGAYLVRKFASETAMAWGTAGYSASNSLIAYLAGTYLNRCSQEVKDNIAEIDVWYANRFSGADSGQYVSSKFFCMSCTEVLINPAVSTQVEGEPWDYWKQKTGLSSASDSHNTGRIAKTASGSSAQYWLRTNFNSSYQYVVNAQGGMGYTAPSVNIGINLLPACAVVAD